MDMTKNLSNLFTACLVLFLAASCAPSTPAAADLPTASLPPATPAPSETPLVFAAPTIDLLSTATPTVPPVTATPSPGWKLVWSDEFDGPNGSPLDPAKWNYDVGGHGWGNNELEYYTSRVDNAYQQDGNMVIEARRETYEGNDYTSARVVTKNKAEWTFGRVEARIKMPTGQGIWPAFWMLPTDRTYGDWPSGGEIDIMEFIGTDPETIYGTLHYGAPHASEGVPFKSLNGKDFSEKFHVFAVEWEPGEIRWYADGFHYQTITRWFTSAENSAFPAPFDQPFHILLNVAVGGNWPGSPDSTTPFPAKMLVDYVRVYQK